MRIKKNTMAKRIYRDLKKFTPKQLSDISQKTKIPLKRLQQAAQGEIKLTSSELEKIPINPTG